MSLTAAATKIINLLTICRKAGKLIMGFDAVREAVAEGKISCILTASDLSPKSLKELNFYVSKAEADIPIYNPEVTMEDLWRVSGKKTGIIAVCDDGFKKAVEKALAEK